MTNSSIFNNELRGTNSAIADITAIANIANPVNENILVSTCIYIAIKGLNIIFLLLKW